MKEENKLPIFLKGNYIFVDRNSKCYEVSSNYTNYLELGIHGITRYYLEAKIEGEEFLISGILLDKKGDVLCQLKDNFIDESKECRKEMTRYGYRINDIEGNLVFEIHVENDLICHLRGIIYEESGEIIAQDKEGEFIILRGPAILGKSDGSIGIKIG